MRLFLERLWHLARPYRGRLIAGVLAGILAGFMEPVMIVTVGTVYGVIFGTGTARQTPEMGDQAAGRATGANPTAETAALTNSSRVADGEGATVSRKGGLRARLEEIQNGVINRLAHGGRSTKLALVALIPLVLLLRGVVGYLNTYFLSWVSVRAVTDLRSRLFEHLLTLPMGFFSRSSSGELLARIANDTMALQSIISQGASTIIKDPITLISFSTLLLWLYPKITLTATVVMPLCILPITVYSRKVRKSSGAIQNYFAHLTQIMVETFTGNRVIKAYNLEPIMTERFRRAAGAFVSAQMRVIRALEMPGPLMEFFGAIGIAMVLGAIEFGFIPKMRPEDFIKVIGSVFSMYRPIKQITRLHAQLEQARAASQRVFDLLDEKSDLPDPAHPKPIRAAGAAIVFDHVDFSYNSRPALRDFCLTIRPGQMVALVGKSGSGKTTAANLLLRFYDPISGAIRIGDVDLREATARDLRSQIAIVTQEIVLFNDTIRANIRLGRPDATDAEVEAAARAAFCHEFILEKPQGYETVVGEKGILLSGGQRQRLAIARALVRNAPILILDEATSALDTESERAVQAAFEQLMKGRTTIVIAHRLSTIHRADMIVVMEEGRILETGTHAELMARGGRYAQLHALGDAGFADT